MDLVICERENIVKINVHRSVLHAVKSLLGVPEDSNLEPLLFILFMNNVANGVICVYLSIFADDIKL